MKKISATIKPTTNRIQAMLLAVPATPDNPSAPAIKATIRKTRAQLNITRTSLRLNNLLCVHLLPYEITASHAEKWEESAHQPSLNDRATLAMLTHVTNAMAISAIAMILAIRCLLGLLEAMLHRHVLARLPSGFMSTECGFPDVFRYAASDRGSELISISEQDVAEVSEDELANFDDAEHAENVALALAV